MPETPPLSAFDTGRLPRLVGRLATANINLWFSAGRLAMTYFNEVATSLREVGNTEPDNISNSVSTPEHEPGLPLLLEGSRGKPAVGAFLVNNRLPARVEAPFTVTRFLADGGRQASPEMQFDPASVVLDPGQQAVVRFSVNVDKLTPGLDYRGEVTMPGMPNGRISLLLRRRSRAAPRSHTTGK